MRIGMMVDTYKPYLSGITNYIELNKKYLEQAGHEVYVFTFGNLDHPDDELNVIRSPGVPLSDTGFYLSMRYTRHAKSILQSMDVVHVHHPFLSGRLSLRYCRPLHIPVVFTNHTRYDLYAQSYLPMMPDEISHGLLQAYMPTFCNAVEMVIAPSAGMKKVLQELKVESPIEVIPNGVDLKDFHNAVPLSRTELGYTSDDILLVYSGRIALEKNLPLLIRSFAGIAQAIPNTHLILIGGGVQQYEKEIRDLVNELNINHRIRFTGKLTYDKLPSYLAMSDIFVTASVSEVHPLSVIEAMGSGLPVMGIDSVGVGDTVKDGETGLLSAHDIAAFTAKLTRLCLDSDLRQQLSQFARHASEVYAIEHTTSIMLSQYEKLVDESKPRKSNWRTRVRGFIERFNT